MPEQPKSTPQPQNKGQEGYFNNGSGSKGVPPDAVGGESVDEAAVNQRGPVTRSSYTEERGFRDFYSAMRRAGFTVQSLFDHLGPRRGPESLPEYPEEHAMASR